MIWNQRRQFFAAVCLCALSLAAGRADVFLDQTSYDAAVGTSILPDDGTLAVIDFPLGTTNFYGHFDVIAAGGPGTPANAATFNSIGNFVWNFDPTDLHSVEFSFDQPITGFSGRWSNTFVQDEFRISTPFNDYDLNDLVPDLDEAFVGITESTPFRSITFSTSNNIPGDDFVFFNSFSYAPVPEPVAMTLAGLLSCGLLVMRRNLTRSQLLDPCG